MTRAPDLSYLVPDWPPPLTPAEAVLSGDYYRLMPLQAEAHVALLFNAYQRHAENCRFTR
jgi:hypothetical protein